MFNIFAIAEEKIFSHIQKEKIEFPIAIFKTLCYNL